MGPPMVDDRPLAAVQRLRQEADRGCVERFSRAAADVGVEV